MHYPRITFVIKDNTYSIDAADEAAIRNIPVEDRRHLINLLEAVKRQHSLSLARVSNVLDKTTISPVSIPGKTAAAAHNPSAAINPTRLGSGDIDALMARLAVEEKRTRKPVVTRTGIYKITAGFLLLIFILVLIA